MTPRPSYCRICRERGEWIASLRWHENVQAWRHTTSSAHVTTKDHEPEPVPYRPAPSVVEQERLDGKWRWEFACPECGSWDGGHHHHRHIDCPCDACNVDDLAPGVMDPTEVSR